MKVSLMGHSSKNKSETIIIARLVLQMYDKTKIKQRCGYLQRCFSEV